MSVQVSTDGATEAPKDSIADMKLEVVMVPVSDVDHQWPSWYARHTMAELTGEGLPS